MFLEWGSAGDKQRDSKGWSKPQTPPWDSCEYVGVNISATKQTGKRRVVVKLNGNTIDELEVQMQKRCTVTISTWGETSYYVSAGRCRLEEWVMPQQDIEGHIARHVDKGSEWDPAEKMPVFKIDEAKDAGSEFIFGKDCGVSQSSEVNLENLVKWGIGAMRANLFNAVTRHLKVKTVVTKIDFPPFLWKALCQKLEELGAERNTPRKLLITCPDVAGRIFKASARLRRHVKRKVDISTERAPIVVYLLPDRYK